jgi:hypothetical protein
MKNLIIGCLIFTATMLGLGFLSTVQAQSSTEDLKTTIVQEQAQDGAFDMAYLDFSTPETSKKSIAFLLSIILTIAVGYIPAVKAWAAKAQNQKAIRIALAALPIVATSLFFGGGFNLNELLQAIFGAIGSAIFLHTMAIKPFAPTKKTLKSDA